MTDSVLGTDGGKPAEGSRDTNETAPGVVAGQTGADGATKDTPPVEGGTKTAEGDKPKEGADAEKDKSKDSPKAPDKYEDFKMPDGVEVDKALLEKATPLFKEAGLPQEVAQKFVDMYAQRVADLTKAQGEQWNQVREGWVNTAKADKEIGGDHWDGKVSDAKVALDKFGTPELRKALNDFGMGDHPEVIRVFSRIGALVKDDKLHLGQGASGAAKNVADLIYTHPTSQPKA